MKDSLDMISRASHVTLVVWAMALLGLAFWPTGCSQGRPAAAVTAGRSPLSDSRQLVLVICDTWDATRAELQCYARTKIGQRWTPIGERIPVSLGRTGLAWGRGLQGDPPLAGPLKREGDGKAPAGIFELPLAFGYAPKGQAADIKLPYLPLTAGVVGVDDPQSTHYNQIVQVDQVRNKDWDSAEIMRRSDDLYEWGVIVNHNPSPAVPGAGSCMFLHVWRGPDTPTAGCTAMSRAQMVRLATWLDPSAKPLLVQLPRPAYRQLAAPWGLP